MSGSGSNVFLVRESFGTFAMHGPEVDGEKFQPWETFKGEEEESRLTTVSPNGTLLAVGNSSLVNIFTTIDGALKCTVRHRLLSAKFSTGDGYLIGWDNPNKNVDNFNIWSLNGGKPSLAHSKKLSKQMQVEFSADEKIYATLFGKSVHFHTVPNFHQIVHNTPDDMKVENFSLSGVHNGQFHVLVFIPASTGPAFAKLYLYPNFVNQITSKSFFQAEKTDMKWNKKGTAVLVITTTSIDKTGESYYGKTMVHYLDIKGDTSTVLTENDSNVIHAAEWCPTSTEFCIITGKMPQTRAILLNTKCEKILDMGVCARNAIHFNPQGNILLVCAFGNLQGSIDVWEIKKHKQLVTRLKVPDTTQLTWLNDGVHFVTATTAPRMQVDNSLRVWNVTGSKIWEWKAGKHLFGVVPFLSNPPLPFDSGASGAEKLIEEFISKPVDSRVSKSGAEVESKKSAVYVPIHKRKGVVGAPMPAKAITTGNSGGGGESSFSEKDKKLRALKKKLEQIEKIKEQKSQGKALEKNQQEKLLKEKEFLEELKQLELS